MLSRRSVANWAEGDNSFAENPPNAVLSFAEPGDRLPEDSVVEIQDPHLDGDALTYSIKVLDGTVPAATGPCALFIDPLGRQGLAEVDSAHPWYSSSRRRISGNEPGCCTGRSYRARSGQLPVDSGEALVSDPSLVRHAQAVGQRRPLGACTNGASVGIGPCRSLLWSTLVVSRRGGQRGATLVVSEVSTRSCVGLTSIRHDLDCALLLTCGNAYCGPRPKGAGSPGRLEGVSAAQPHDQRTLDLGVNGRGQQVTRGLPGFQHIYVSFAGITERMGLAGTAPHPSRAC